MTASLRRSNRMSGSLARLAGALAFLSIVAPVSAEAGSGSSVYRGDVATLSLSVGQPDASGHVEGILSIDLDEGWKTYWLDPGPSGISPQIDFSSTGNVAETRLRAPLPMRFGEGLGRATGYEGRVAFVFTLTTEDGGAIEGPVVADVFIGVCEDICVPVEARLSAELALTPPAVDRAIEKLPAEADPSAVSISTDGDTLTIELRTDAAIADVFVRPPDGWYLGEARPAGEDGGVKRFTVPIEARAKTGSLDIVDLVFDDGGRGLELDAATVDQGKPKS